MISVEQALAAVEQCAIHRKRKVLPLNDDLLGMVLSKDINAPFDLPRFDTSAMDGYAVKLGGNSRFSLLEKVISAGTSDNFELNPGEAIRIFTGAFCPDSADAVVMQEHTEVIQNTMMVEKSIQLGQNIRRQGEEIKKGEVVLSKGHLINPASIGVIANFGIAEVEVFQKPSCAILTTGNELVAPGNDLDRGSIYDSNSYMLSAFLRSQGIDDISINHISDDLEKTKLKIKTALENYDILLISGGISVGDYDFVKEACEANQVAEVFHKVKQKPGKPLFFGIKEDKYVFGLPGNPASALTNAYIYVLPMINRLKGKASIHLRRLNLPLANGFSRKPGRAQFYKALISEEQVEILEGQGSGMLQSFALCNALVFVSAETTSCNQGDLIQVIPLKT